jgi:hypothetical protein
LNCVRLVCRDEAWLVTLAGGGLLAVNCVANRIRPLVRRDRTCLSLNKKRDHANHPRQEGAGDGRCERYRARYRVGVGARQGAELFLVDVDEPNLRASASAAEKFGARVVVGVRDLSQSAQVTVTVNNCQATFGGLDILVNSAGVLHYGRPTNCPRTAGML